MNAKRAFDCMRFCEATVHNLAPSYKAEPSSWNGRKASVLNLDLMLPNIVDFTETILLIRCHATLSQFHCYA